MALPDSVVGDVNGPPGDGGVPQGGDDLPASGYEQITLPKGVKGIKMRDDSTDGKIGSPGVEVRALRYSPGMETSLAEERGLRAGMIITHVNGVPVDGKNLDQVSEEMAGAVTLAFHNPAPAPRPRRRSVGGGRKKKTAHKKRRNTKRRTKKRRTKKRRTKKRRNTKRRTGKR